MEQSAEPGESLTTEALLEELASEDHVTRHKARRHLAFLGRSVIPQLQNLLLHAKVEHVRWEAAKVLGSIGGEEAVEVLASALPDPSSDVRWSAVQGLIEGGESAYHPILHQLIIHSSNIGVREAAMHVLSHAVREEHSTFLRPVLTALRGRAPVFEVSLAAYQAMVTYHRTHARLDAAGLRKE